MVNFIDGGYITLCMDGWSSRRKEKSINFVVFCKKQLSFWKNTHVLHQSVAELSATIKACVESLETVGAHIIAICGDNLGAQQTAIEDNCGPGVFQVRCAAHSIQLIVHDLLMVQPLAGLNPILMKHH